VPKESNVRCSFSTDANEFGIFDEPYPELTLDSCLEDFSGGFLCDMLFVSQGGDHHAAL
jgi:hypothetical protein